MSSCGPGWASRAIHSQLHALWHGLPSVSGDHPPFSPPCPGQASQGGGLGAWPSRRLRPGPLLPPTGPVSPRLAPSLRFRTATSQSSHSIVFRSASFLSLAEVTKVYGTVQKLAPMRIIDYPKVPETHDFQVFKLGSGPKRT